MDIYEYIDKICSVKTHEKTRKKLAELLGIKYHTFLSYETKRQFQPKQEKVIKEVIDTWKPHLLPKFEYKCKYCERIFYTQLISKNDVCEFCKADLKCGKKKEVLNRQATLNRRKKRNNLSVDDILSIGKKHGIYSYGKIVQMIENGEIRI